MYIFWAERKYAKEENGFYIDYTINKIMKQYEKQSKMCETLSYFKQKLKKHKHINYLLLVYCIARSFMFRKQFF